MVAGSDVSGREESPSSTGQGRWVTPSPGDGKESATENRPPPDRVYLVNMRGKGETVR